MPSSGTSGTTGIGFESRIAHLGSPCSRPITSSIVSAPIRCAVGAVVAAVSVSGPAFRLPEKSFEEVGGLTAEAAAEISRCLGFRA
jgi:transcriptional regulator